MGRFHAVKKWRRARYNPRARPFDVMSFRRCAMRATHRALQVEPLRALTPSGHQKRIESRGDCSPLSAGSFTDADGTRVGCARASLVGS